MRDSQRARSSSPAVARTRVAPTGHYKRNLTETVPYIGAETLQGLRVTGKGVRVAVIDSGVDLVTIDLGWTRQDKALAAALRWYADRFAQQTHLAMHLCVEEIDDLPVEWLLCWLEHPGG